MNPAPYIIVDEFGRPGQNYELSYDIIPTQGYQIESSTLSLFQNNNQIMSQPTGIGAGAYTITNSQTFNPASAYSLNVNVVPYTGNALVSSTTAISKRVNIPVSQINVMATGDVPTVLDGTDEIRFGNGKNPEKVYTINIASAVPGGVCTNVSGVVRVIDRTTNQKIQPPSAGQFHPVEYPLETTQTSDGKCHVNLRTVDGKRAEKFIVTNQPMGDPELSLDKTAALYGGLGKHSLQIVLNNVPNTRPIEPVGGGDTGDRWVEAGCVVRPSGKRRIGHKSILQRSERLRPK